MGLGVQRSLGFKGQHHIIKKQNMELLYYICGILSVGIIYAIFLLRRNQTHYHDALARLQSHQNISSIRNGDVKEKLHEQSFNKIQITFNSNFYNCSYINDISSTSLMNN